MRKIVALTDRVDAKVGVFSGGTDTVGDNDAIDSWVASLEAAPSTASASTGPYHLCSAYDLLTGEKLDLLQGRAVQPTTP